MCVRRNKARTKGQRGVTNRKGDSALTKSKYSAPQHHVTDAIQETLSTGLPSNFENNSGPKPAR